MFSRLLIAGLFILLGSQSGMTADYTYEGFIGPTAPKNQDDDENSAARLALSDNAATIYMPMVIPRRPFIWGGY
jgi:hypothetical protein